MSPSSPQGPAPAGQASAVAWRGLAEPVREAVIGLDEHGMISVWTGDAECLFGWTVEEAIGRSSAELVPPERRGLAREQMRLAAADDPDSAVGAGPIRVTGYTRSGRRFPAELKLSVGYTAGVRFFVCLVRDATTDDAQRLELQIAESRLRTTFEHAPIGMTMTEPGGVILAANPAFATLVGRPREDIVGRTIGEITHPTDRERTLGMLQDLRSGERSEVRTEQRFLRPDGGSVWADVSVVLVRDLEGRPLHYIGHAQDIGESRRIASELERSNTELSQFAHVASHDLNEPLRIVDGFLSLLDRRAGDRLGEDGKRFVEHARSATARMRELIDAFLRYARAGGGELELADVDLEQITREAVAALGASIAEHRATVHVQAPLPHACGDAPLLRQVLQNVLGNAVRHSAEGGGHVVVAACTTASGEVEVSVKDDGDGIPPERRERVFDAFVGGGEGAAGLGLAICRRVIERHGGRMWIADTPGGADVRFTLPYAV